MPLNVYPNIRASGSVPAGWVAVKGGTLKYPVKNVVLLSYLRAMLPGDWQKVVKEGVPGAVHYFEHASGRVADVKYFP